MKKVLLIGGGIIIGLIVLLVSAFFALPTVLSMVDGADQQLKDDSDLLPPRVDISKPGNSFGTLSKLDFGEEIYPELNQWFSETNPKPIDWNRAREILRAHQTELALFNQAAKQGYYQIPALADPEKIEYHSEEAHFVPFSNYRIASKIAALNALNLAEQGQIELAIDQALDIYNVGHMMMQGNNSLISSLLGMAIAQLGLNTHQTIATDSKLTPGQRAYVKQYLSERDDNTKGFETAMKYEYQVTKQILSEWKNGNFDSIIESSNEADISEEALAYKKLGQNNYYFKINMTINEAAELTRARLQAVKNPCQVALLSDSDRFNWLKIYYTENSIGKLLNNVSMFALSSTYNKQCSLETNLESVINS